MTCVEEIAILSRIVLFSDQRAFGRLVEHYQERVRRFFLLQSGGDEMLSDDLAQETFLRVWERLHSFRQASSFSTWLYQIAYHIWLDHCKQRCVFSSDIELNDNLLRVEEDETNDNIQRLCRALASMSEPARTCITLFYLEEKSVREIAQIIELSENNIRQILSRGRKKLKEIYERTE